MILISCWLRVQIRAPDSRYIIGKILRSLLSFDKTKNKQKGVGYGAYGYVAKMCFIEHGDFAKNTI